MEMRHATHLLVALVIIIIGMFSSGELRGSENQFSKNPELRAEETAPGDRIEVDPHPGDEPDIQFGVYGAEKAASWCNNAFRFAKVRDVGLNVSWDQPSGTGRYTLQIAADPTDIIGPDPCDQAGIEDWGGGGWLVVVFEQESPLIRTVEKCVSLATVVSMRSDTYDLYLALGTNGEDSGRNLIGGTGSAWGYEIDYGETENFACQLRPAQ